MVKPYFNWSVIVDQFDQLLVFCKLFRCGYHPLFDMYKILQYFSQPHIDILNNFRIFAVFLDIWLDLDSINVNNRISFLIKLDSNDICEHLI